MISALISVLQNTITPLLTAGTLALLGMFFAWLQKKSHIQANQAGQDYIESLAVRAIAFAEEEGAQFIKEHGSKLPSDTKFSDAVTFLLRSAPRLSEDEARDLITAALGKTAGAGATEDRAVGAPVSKMDRKGFAVLRTVLTIFMLCCLPILASCATWKANTTAGYETTGQILTDIGTKAKSMCDAGKIPAKNCVVLKADYNKARTAYISSGNALILAIDAQDAAAKKTSLAAYQEAITDLGTLLPALVNAAGEFGVNSTVRGASAPGAGIVNGGTAQ